MDRIMGYIKQYRYVALVLILGIGLMCLPSAGEKTEEAYSAEETAREKTLEERLESILSGMEGVGQARVLLAVAAGTRTIYQENEDVSTSDSGESIRRDAILITDENRREQGLVQQVISPEYEGAIVLCRGGDQPQVRLAVVEAVSNVTGLTADKITVLKMK